MNNDKITFRLNDSRPYWKQILRGIILSLLIIPCLVVLCMGGISIIVLIGQIHSQIVELLKIFSIAFGFITILGLLFWFSELLNKE